MIRGLRRSPVLSRLLRKFPAHPNNQLQSWGTANLGKFPDTLKRGADPFPYLHSGRFFLFLLN